MQLSDIAQVIRSKNAGPRCTTLDVMFATEADYRRVAESNALTVELIAGLYDQPVANVRIIHYPVAMAIKIVIPRKVTAGDPGDRDVYGAQQHARLFGVQV